MPHYQNHCTIVEPKGIHPCSGNAGESVLHLAMFCQGQMNRGAGPAPCVGFLTKNPFAPRSAGPKAVLQWSRMSTPHRATDRRRNPPAGGGALPRIHPGPRRAWSVAGKPGHPAAARWLRAHVLLVCLAIILVLAFLAEMPWVSRSLRTRALAADVVLLFTADCGGGSQ